MSDWTLWGAFSAGVGVCFAGLKGAVVIKSLLPSKAKPQLSEPEDCFIFPTKGVYGIGKLSFDLLVDNSKGSKSCSLMSVELKFPDGVVTDFVYKPGLPTTISAGQTERVNISGDSHKANGFELLPDNTAVEATAVAKFNSKKTIEKKITFIIKRP